TRALEINGVGYRAEVRGNVVVLTLGYSHPIHFRLPPGLSAKVDRQVMITLEGADRELLGQAAAALRELRPPEPYKAKGVKYAEERIRRQAGGAVRRAALPREGDRQDRVRPQRLPLPRPRARRGRGGARGRTQVLRKDLWRNVPPADLAASSPTPTASS